MSDREPADEKQDEQDQQDGAGEQPDEQEIEEEREKRLDPENRPDNAEVDNSERTFDPETGFFTDTEEHDQAEPKFVDEDAISEGSDARGDEAEDGSEDEAQKPASG